MSVYKDSKRGTYYVSFSQKDILTGKFRHVMKRGFLTKQEAKQWSLIYILDESNRETNANSNPENSTGENF